MLSLSHNNCLFSSLLTFVLLTASFAQADETSLQAQSAQQAASELNKPLYTPFIERYILDEIKQLRVEQAANKLELNQKILDREHQSVDRAVAYATDTITYFFYLMAAASSILVIVGWTSIRDIKERVHSFANQEILKLVEEYERRLSTLESQLTQKTQHIEENREEIELTQEIQSLWLRAQQDTSPTGKIDTYDEILKRRPDDCEALTYKADAALELGEPKWAINLCQQALKIDPENSHAFYQLAGALTAQGHLDEAIEYLTEAVSRRESYRKDIASDDAFIPLHDLNAYKELIDLSTLPS